MIEEEDEKGFTRLSLVVHPKIHLDNENTIIETVLGALVQGKVGPGQGGFAAEMTRKIWNQANTLRVKRMAPILTGHGKMLPLHVAKNQKV